MVVGGDGTRARTDPGYENARHGEDNKCKG